MKSRELFRLAIKLVGFIILLQGLRSCVEALLILKGYAAVRLSTPQYWAAWAMIKIVAGVYLMVGVTPFVNLAFPLKREATAEATATTPNADQAESVMGNGPLMDPKVIFDLIVKTVGLIVLLYGVQYFVDSLLYAMRTPESTEVSNHSWMAFSVIEASVGLAMLRGVVPLVDFAFPGERIHGQAKTDEAETQDETHDA